MIVLDEPQRFRGLQYPYGARVDVPAGEPVRIAEGVWWVRFRMPMALNHINLWLLEDGDGWTIVDTCARFDGAMAQWESLFSGFMQNKPVRRVICTHMHPDHVGLAGWLTERFGCDLWMSRGEYLTCRLMADDTGPDVPQVAIDFYHRAGWNAEQLDRYRERFGLFGTVIYPLPDSYHRLQDGQTIEVNGRYWQIVAGSGHSPEHMMLYCPSLKLLISGDQVLPRITSNVSVTPLEPNGDPLRDWLHSCAHIREIMPENVFVLPAHQEPFWGVNIRMSQLIESHDKALDALLDHLAEPRRAIDCFEVLFEREINNEIIMMATGETLAHLHCLIGRRMASVRVDESGIAWYSQRPEALQTEELI